ncbi:MAG: hypothetical protein Kow0098_21540 [Ignavibacteriaceae bacterium]
MTEELIKYLDSLYGYLRFPVQVVNSEGKIVYVNKSFTLQWGYNIEELGEYSVFSDQELKKRGIVSEIKNALENNETSTAGNFVDSFLISGQSAPPLLRTTIFPLEINHRKYIVLFHEDQTEIVLTEEEVKKARDAGKEAERLKNTFLNVLSHELRTPLNIILGYSSIIKENLKDKISSEDKIYLDNLHSGSERLFKSITQMLEFAQIEAGTYTLNIEPVNLIPLLKNSISTMEKTAIEKQLDVRINFPDENIFVDADLHCVENAVNNLLNNAVKFTHKGFIEIESSILKDRELAICKIRDSGIGISAEYLDHLFQPFSQEDLNIGRNFEGNGLGLALAKRYIEKLGGSLLVDSIKGVGSTFTFTLPLSKSHSADKSNGTDKESPSKRKILMLDDTGETFGLLKAFLKKDFEIVEYDLHNFKLDLVKSEDFGLLVFDVNKNFWEQGLLICRDIKRNDPFNRPVVIISSEFLEEKIKKYYEAGAAKYLIKPFTKNELLSALSELNS